MSAPATGAHFREVTLVQGAAGGHQEQLTAEGLFEPCRGRLQVLHNKGKWEETLTHTGGHEGRTHLFVRLIRRGGRDLIQFHVHSAHKHVNARGTALQ